MLEYLNYNSNGFKSLGNKLNTGFDINEITSKFRFEIFKKSKTKQSLEYACTEFFRLKCRRTSLTRI